MHAQLVTYSRQSRDWIYAKTTILWPTEYQVLEGSGSPYQSRVRNVLRTVVLYSVQDGSGENKRKPDQVE